VPRSYGILGAFSTVVELAAFKESYLVNKLGELVVGRCHSCAATVGQPHGSPAL
jgi:hypothetical protein